MYCYAQNNFVRLTYDWSHTGRTQKTLKITGHGSVTTFSMRQGVIIWFWYTFSEHKNLEPEWTNPTNVKRSTQDMSILQSLFNQDFNYFYRMILPCRTEGLSDSSISAMFLQTSPNWRKNWITFRAFRSISQVFTRSRFLLLSGTLVVEQIKDFDWSRKQLVFTLEPPLRKRIKSGNANINFWGKINALNKTNNFCHSLFNCLNARANGRTFSHHFTWGNQTIFFLLWQTILCACVDAVTALGNYQ